MHYLESNETYISYLSSDRIPFPRNLQIELVHSPSSPQSVIPRLPMIQPPTDLMEINTEILDYITSSILPYVHRIEIVGNADPLLSENAVITLLENAQLFKVPVALSCDPERLDDARVSCLIANNLSEVTIALDAATPETFQKLHGMDFETALQRILSIREIASRENRKPPKINISCVALTDNIDELPQMLYLIKQLDASALHLYAFGDEPEPFAGRSAFLHNRDQAEFSLYKTLIEAEINRIQFKVFPELLMSVISESNDLDGFLRGESPPPGDSTEWRKDCAALWDHPLISVSGEVKPCGVAMPAIGNLASDSFQTIWYSKPFLSLRKNCLLGHLSDICSRCNTHGWRRSSPLKSNLLASDESFKLFTGWYDLELEEREFRSTRERATLFLKRTGAEKFVLLQLRKLALPKASMKGTITLNATTPIPFQLKSTDWETIEFPLPAMDSQEVLQVEINMSHSIRPADIDEASDDPREKGIKFARAWVEEWPQKVVFGQQLILLGYEILPESLVIGGDVILRTFWRSLDQTTSNLKVAVSFQLEDSPDTIPPKHRSAVRRDSFSEDHLILLHGQPSSAWDIGTFIAYEHRFSVPDDLVAGHYRVELNLYPEGTPKARLPINRSDRPIEDDRVLLCTIMISQK